MSRPLRIQRPGGRYHVTARGNERKAIYRDDCDRSHFLQLLVQLTHRAEREQIICGVEQAKGQKWSAFCQTHGDWGRDAALWLGRKLGRLTLGELGAKTGGMDYAAVGQAVSRFGKRLEQDPDLRNSVEQIKTQLSNVEM